MKFTLVGYIFMYEKVRIFLLNKSVFYEVMIWHDVRYLICVFKMSTLH